MVYRLLGLFLIALAGRADDSYALVIGITGYPHFAADQRLRFADRDARRFAQFLNTPAAGSFPSNNVRLLVNEQATRQAIYREMKWLADRVNGNDRLYVFFAGHGIVDSVSERAYFMPYDADPANPGGLGMRADNFLQDLRDMLTAKRMIFFIDACHAAAAMSRSGSARNSLGMTDKLNALWREEFAGKQELNMGFFSASSNQRSFEDTEFRHGIFTWYLLEGLEGAADRDNNGKVEAGELRRYLSDRVEERSKQRFQAAQTPTISPVFVPEIALAIFGAPSSQAAQEITTAPVSKRGGPPAASSEDILGKVSGRVTAAPFPKKQDQQQRYRFTVTLQMPATLASRVRQVDYWFQLETNPLYMTSVDRTQGFPAVYEGWGCYSSVYVTLSLDSGEKLSKTLNMCSLLGW